MILTHGANSLKRSGGGAVIGGRTYRTVVMPDGKEWLAENLDYKFEYNGSTLPIGGSGSPRTPNAWYYNNNETDYGIDGTYKCGLLYNWDAIKYLDDNKSTLCPGWHVPTKDEWDALVTAIGGISTAGTVLKATDNSIISGFPSGWNGMDDYGFSILPAGLYGGAGNFFSVGVDEYFWTSTNYNANASYHIQFTTSASMSSGTNNKINGFSIRLVKDVT